MFPDVIVGEFKSLSSVSSLHQKMKDFEEEFEIFHVVSSSCLLTPTVLFPMSSPSLLNVKKKIENQKN